MTARGCTFAVPCCTFTAVCNMRNVAFLSRTSLSTCNGACYPMNAYALPMLQVRNCCVLYCLRDRDLLRHEQGIYRYLFGHHFVIFTDHKSLSHLFDSSRAIPQLASARIQRWALTLSAYSYTIEYKSGQLIPMLML